MTPVPKRAKSHVCTFPVCVDGERPEHCGDCGDAIRAEAAEARVSELVAALREIRDNAYTDGRYHRIAVAALKESAQ